MGARESRPTRERGSVRGNRQYVYPPSDGGSYFSTHYHLGHRKFESGEPELFLFGENSDLNFLTTKPVAFPYKQPHKSQPVRCLRSFINLQRDSLKLIKVEGSSDDYHLQFTFDSDVNCAFTIYSGLPDTVELSSLKNSPYSGDGVTVSCPYHYSAGSEQKFDESSYTLSLAQLGEDRVTYDPESDCNSFPVVIAMNTDNPEAPESQQQSQITLCTLERITDNGCSIKVLKQKLIVDGVEYLLQEIYGIENKLNEQEEVEETGSNSDSDDDIEELGAECVICITDVRDTILLPCRHLCLCAGCAANLRYQSSNCPVCRAPFRALLHIQALEALDPEEPIDDDEATGNPKYAVPGFRRVPLLQALNGYQLECDTVYPDQEPENNNIQQDALQNSPTDGPTMTTTEFCVIPIEDEVQDTDNVSPEPADPPSRTVVSPPNNKTGTSRSQAYHVQESILLPGTPTSMERELEVKIRPDELTTSTAATTAIDLEEDQDVPGSPPCASNLSQQSCSTASSTVSSSAGSTNSTDMLLPSPKSN